MILAQNGAMATGSGSGSVYPMVPPEYAGHVMERKASGYGHDIALVPRGLRLRFGKRDGGLDFDDVDLDSDGSETPFGGQTGLKMRFGKRSVPTNQQLNLRFGKRSDIYSPSLRFGKKSEDFGPSLRFGKKSSDDFGPSLRFGKKSASPSLRFGKKSSEYSETELGNEIDKILGAENGLRMRFGKRLSEQESYQPSLRFGKKSFSDDVVQPSLRFGKKSSESAVLGQGFEDRFGRSIPKLRFGKRSVDGDEDESIKSGDKVSNVVSKDGSQKEVVRL